MGAPSPSEPRLDERFNELNSKLDGLRNELDKSLAEVDQLRAEVRTLRGQLGQTGEAETAGHDAESLRESVAQLHDTTEILQAEVKVHDQTKLETASKFPVRIGGTLLLTSFFNTGSVNDFNLPTVAIVNPQHSAAASLSATASQTILGLDATGPRLGSGRTSADLNVDFWGPGTATPYYTAAAGSLRLRTAHARLEWPRQSIEFALDRPLLSPVRPNSWLTVAEPAFAWSGNLWSWLPQLDYRTSVAPAHRFDLQLGLLDTAVPANYNGSNQPVPNPAELSRRPGYQARISTGSSWHDLPITIGASGYYSRKSYPSGRVDAWAGAADWEIPLAPILALAGEFYRGRSLGGLGGGTFKDYVTSLGEPYGLNAAGGWAQLTAHAMPTLQGNFGFGLDTAFAKDLNEADPGTQQNFYSNLARNQTLLGNIIYRPKTYLLLSAEFRQINSRSIAGHTSQDRVFGLVTGYTF
jgi:hypothetical protein